VVRKENGKDSGGSGHEQLDVFEAIQAHVQWKQRLLGYIHGTGEEVLDPERVGSDCLCSLGQWIYGHGGSHYGGHPRFGELKSLHADFHFHAAEVVRAVHRGQGEDALELLQKGEYAKVSNRIKSMLARLSLELDFG